MASVFFRGSLIVAFLLRLFFWKFCSTFHKASHRPPNSKIAPCQLDCFKPSAFEKFRQGQARRKVILSPSRYIRPPQPPPLPRRKGRRKRCGCWKAHSTDVVDKIGNTWGLRRYFEAHPTRGDTDGSRYQPGKCSAAEQRHYDEAMPGISSVLRPNARYSRP